MRTPEESPPATAPTWQRVWPKLALLIALGLHFALATTNWSSRFLPGHEFRQAQTALTTAFVAREQNYDLAYPTPLFGPPWSIPMEFPLYQWAAAWLSTHSDWSVVESARAVNLACFYLALPGLLLLLREVRPQDVAGRWLALVCILCSPVYVFYTRSVLIESMALMFCVWFLWTFVRMCRHRSWAWAVIASVLGALAALVKVTTFMAWCGFAAIGGVLWSWRQWRQHGWSGWGRSVGLGAVAASLPGIASLWWVRTADAIKATSPGGSWLQSDNLRDFNLGTWSDRTTGSTWTQAASFAFQAVTPAWAAVAILIGATWLWLRRRDSGPWTALGWFIAVPFLFPILYSYHDYYFYANAVALLTAAGLLIAALQRLPGKASLVAPFVLLALCAAQLHGYFKTYRDLQTVISPGGSMITAMVREKLPQDSVIVVMGDDWSAAIPFYADRRAFMIRNAMLGDPAGTAQMLDCLKDEMIGGLIVTKDQRDNVDIINAVTAKLGLDPQPSVTHANNDFYLSDSLRGALTFALLQDSNYRALMTEQFTADSLADIAVVADGSMQAVAPALGDSMFAIATPRPHHYRAQFPLEVVTAGNAIVLTAHPESEIWFTPPSEATEVSIGFGMRPESYQRDESRSDGVEFLVFGIGADGEMTTIFERVLEPNSRDTDQGLQTAQFELPQPLPVQLVFATRRNHSLSFDWAYWQKIQIH